MARTLNVCGPAASAVYVAGDSQSANARSSSEHSNAESTSFALNVNVALVAVVELGGFSRIVVSGGTATVHVYSTGVSSARPYAGVLRRDGERVLAVLEAAVRLRDRAERLAETVEVAEELDAGLVGGELERRRRGVARIGREGDERRLGRRQHRPLVAGRRQVGVEREVGRPHLEGVVARLDLVLLRRVALGERLTVERALERRAGLGGEGERSRPWSGSDRPGDVRILVSGASVSGTASTVQA